MHTDDPKPSPESSVGDAPDTSSQSRESFDIRALESMPEEEADAEWLRQPEAWHLH
jgi:hypothetical protein